MNWQEHAMLTGVAPKFTSTATVPWWRRLTVVGAIGLFVLTLLLYAPVGQFEFVDFDDSEYVYDNTHLNRGISWSGIAWAFTKSHSANWHPLTWLSHMFDCQLWGATPGPMHWHNVLLHALNAVLLFGWLRQATGATGRSWVVAALFAWHPLHVESVAWISERKDVLSAFWGIATLWCYTCYQQATPDTAGRRPRRFYGWGLVCFGLGLMSKPMLVTWPFVLLLLDFWPGQRCGRESWQRLWREKLPFFALSALSSVVTSMVQTGAKQSWDVITWDHRLGNAVKSYGLYLWQMIYPDDLQPFYPLGTLVIWRVALAFVVMLGLSLIIWRWRQQCGWAFFGWNWYLGTLVPVIGLMQVGNQALADRYSYLPLIGIFILVVWFGQRIGERFSQRGTLALQLTAAGILIACCWLTRQQVWRWQNSITLFAPVAARFPDNYVGHAIVGAAYAQQTNYPQAIFHLQRAIEILPTEPDSYKEIGDIFVVSNRLDDAIACYQRAIELQPTHFASQYQLAMALTKQDRNEEALQAFTAATTLKPDNSLAQYHLANTLVRLRRVEPAIPHYERALQLQPNRVEVLNNLAYAYAQIGKADHAIATFQQALQLNPELAETRVNLGAILLRQNQIAPAIEQFQIACRQKPDLAVAYLNLGLAYARAGNWSDAARVYQSYLTLQPNQPDGYLKIADALLHLSQPQPARTHLETALQLARSQSRSNLVTQAEEMLRNLSAPATNSATTPSKVPNAP